MEYLTQLIDDTKIGVWIKACSYEICYEMWYCGPLLYGAMKSSESRWDERGERGKEKEKQEEWAVAPLKISSSIAHDSFPSHLYT